MTKIVNHWIGGKTVEGASGNYGPVTDPATGAVTTKVAFASVDEVDAAVAAAKDAFATWGTSSLAKRTTILFRFRALLEANRDAIAELITAEHGKVHSDALGEVARGLEIVDLACGITVQLKGELSTEVASRVDVSSIRQPLGVVAGITPFNFPAMVPMWMFPIAIATGNTFVLKPSRRTRRPPSRSPSCWPRPVCRTACSTSCTATRWRWTACLSTRTSRRCPSSARP